MKQIRTVNLGKTYGKEKFPALENLNLEIEKNTIFGFLGPNGSGKTTTLKLLTGLMKPSGGEIWIGDRMISMESYDMRYKIGYLSQSPRYYDWMTGIELMRMVGSIFNLSKKDAALRADELLELTGLSEHGKRRIRTYSGGMVQRLGIAQALVNRPEVLFLDEPVSDMDPLGRKEVLEFINSLRGNITVFMSTHILEDVERVCDTVGIINKGRLIRVAETGSLKREFGTTRVILGFHEKSEADGCEDWLKNCLDTSLFSRNNNSFTVSQLEFDQCRSSFLHWAADNGPSLEKLQILAPTLEDIFVNIIGGDNEKPHSLSSIA